MTDGSALVRAVKIRGATAVLAASIAACSSSSGSADAGATSSAAPTATASAPAASAASGVSTPLLPLDEPGVSSSAVPVFGLPPPPAEARRATVTRLADDRALAPHEAVIRAHFGGALPATMEVQTTPLFADRSAVLIYGPAQQREPLILVLDAHGALVWSKERPLAGTRQIVTEMVVAPGPRGEVALMWCDIPTQVVALRKWGWDGTVLADFEVAEVELCEALAGLYWPGHGWLSVASQHGAARVQLLDQNGKRAFGPRGVELPWKARPSAPAAIAIDSETSAMIFQVGDLPREGVATLDRLLGMRIDTLGTSLWERPLDIGAASLGGSGAGGTAGPRVQATVRSPGNVRVALGKMAPVNVTSAGSIQAR